MRRGKPSVNAESLDYVFRVEDGKVLLQDSVILEMPLKAAESIGRGNLSQRAFDAVSELMIGLFRAGAERL